MGTHKPPVFVDHAKCPPCSGLICIGVCPLGVLETDADGKPILVDAGSCNQCGVCVNLCPAKAIITSSSKNVKSK